MGLGRLFHKEGGMYDKFFWPVLLALRKGSLSLTKIFRVSILQCGGNSKISFRWIGQLLLTNLKGLAFMHWWTLFSFGRQPLYQFKIFERYMNFFVKHSISFFLLHSTSFEFDMRTFLVTTKVALCWYLFRQLFLMAVKI